MDPDPLIAGEITPQPHQTNAAGLILQQQGFQVLHLGRTISVQAPKSLWESLFHIQFIPERKPLKSDTPQEEKPVYRPDMNHVAIPLAMQHLIQDIAVSEPPELFKPC